MSAPEISSAAAEPIALTWVQNGTPVTGGSPTMRVSRYSDSYTTVLDWSTGAFVAPASAVLPYVALAQVSATYNAGLYFREFDLTSIVGAVAPDIYRIAFYEDATLDLPIDTGEIRVGTVDTIDDTAADVTTILGYTPAATAAATWATVITGNETLGQAGGALNVLRGALLNPLIEAEGDPGTLILKKNDGVTTWVTWTLLDQDGNAVVGSPGEPARRSAGT